MMSAEEHFDALRQPVHREVTVCAFERLHLGFLDPQGSGERTFGSIGMALSRTGTVLKIEPSNRLIFRGPSAARAERYFQALRSIYRISPRVKISIKKASQPHIGLGSGTQMALAVGSAVSAMYDLKLEPSTIMENLGRGGRSGIGLGAFAVGGFLVDGGRDISHKPPRITVRAKFPETWRVLLMVDDKVSGIHGDDEVRAFGALPKVSDEFSAKLCRLVLMGALPALVEANIASFSKAICQVQEMMGSYFSSAQGGSFSSERIAQLLGWLRLQGVVGCGQTSWGPTGFVIFGSEAEAQSLLAELSARRALTEHVSFYICNGRNRGARLKIK